MILWEAADHRHPPVDARDIRRFGLDVKEGGVVTPSVANTPVALRGLLYGVISAVAPSEKRALRRRVIEL